MTPRRLNISLRRLVNGRSGSVRSSDLGKCRKRHLTDRLRLMLLKLRRSKNNMSSKCALRNRLQGIRSKGSSKALKKPGSHNSGNARKSLKNKPRLSVKTA